MPLIDPRDTGGFQPGLYLAEVKDAELKHGQTSGDPYFGVTLCGAGMNGARSQICKDVLMLDGKGKGMGVARLKALGFFEGDEPQDVQAHELVGRRCWVRVGWQPYKDRNGETRRSLKPVGSFDPFDCGYYHESEPPADASEPVFDPESDVNGGSLRDAPDDGSTPF